MSETKFTPGPWIAAPMEGEPGHCFAAQVVRTDGAGRWIVDINSDDGEEMATANAHLIAAAPELYEALEPFEHLRPDSHCDSILALLPAVRAALAKARGKQP